MSVPCLYGRYIDTSMQDARTLSLLDDKELKREYPGAYILHTCHRLEIYSVISLDDDPFVRYFGLQSALVVGESAVSRLFRIAAGLESEIWGESAILVQFENAINRSSLGADLFFLLRNILTVARHVRLEADFFTGDHAELSIEYTLEKFGKDFFIDRIVFIMGSGMLAQSASRALRKNGCRTIVVLTNNPATAERRFRMDGLVFSRYSALPHAFFEKRFFVITAAGHLSTEEALLSRAIIADKYCDGCLDLMMPPLFLDLENLNLFYVNLFSENLSRFINKKNQHQKDKRGLVECFLKECQNAYV